MSFRWQIAFSLAALGATLAAFEFVSIGEPSLDQWVQDHFYDFHTRLWLVDGKGKPGRTIFYVAPKVIAVTVGVVCAMAVLASFIFRRLKPFRRGCFLLTMSLIFVPLLISGLKVWTNVYMPNETTRYGGRHPYVRLMEPYPPNMSGRAHGRGFPAGHATAGFAYMAIYFAAKKRKWKCLGLAGGLSLGWTLGLYQTFNGQHYISHTMVTMIVSWIIILMLNRIIPRCDVSPVAPPGFALTWPPEIG